MGTTSLSMNDCHVSGFNSYGLYIAATNVVHTIKNSTFHDSNHGLYVGNKFNASPGFYINGPLLAGNVVEDMGIWHVEHCGRIISFAKKIAANIIEEKNY